MRKLKHHESKLLKKVNFYSWKSDNNVKVAKVMRTYRVDDREDYVKYDRLSRLIQEVTGKLKEMKQDDEDRIKMTQIMLDKLYSMGLINNPQSLNDIHKIPAATFCRRRLPVVLVRNKFVDNMYQAVNFVQQGHIRIGPDIVSNPKLHVTREMEDHITWAEGSKVKKSVKEFAEQVDDFELLGN